MTVFNTMKLSKIERDNLIKEKPFMIVDGKWLKAKLLENGINQSDFAKLVGTNAPHISRQINGILEINTIRKFAYYYFFKNL